MTPDIDVLAEAALMPIPPEYRAGVAVTYAALAVQAQLLLDWKLPEDTAPAALFTP